jgi:hypothetical protein
VAAATTATSIGAKLENECAHGGHARPATHGGCSGPYMRTARFAGTKAWCAHVRVPHTGAARALHVWRAPEVRARQPGFRARHVLATACTSGMRSCGLGWLRKNALGLKGLMPIARWSLEK